MNMPRLDWFWKSKRDFQRQLAKIEKQVKAKKQPSR